MADAGLRGAGPSLDAEVEEYVMHMASFRSPVDGWVTIPNYSTSIAAAWLVVDRMRKHTFSIRHRFIFEEMSRAVSSRIARDQNSGLSPGDRIQDAQAWFMAEPVDICLAALAALEVPRGAGDRA